MPLEQATAIAELRARKAMSPKEESCSPHGAVGLRDAGAAEVASRKEMIAAAPPIEERESLRLSEGHNWTLYCWGKDIYEGRRPTQGNVIINIDSHIDLSRTSSGLWTSFDARNYRTLTSKHSSPEEKIAALLKETKRTDIGEFILKAIALGWANEFVWIKPDASENKLVTTKYYQLEEKKSGDRVIITGRLLDHKPPPGTPRVFCVREMTLSDAQALKVDPLRTLATLDLDAVHCDTGSGLTAGDWRKLLEQSGVPRGERGWRRITDPSDPSGNRLLPDNQRIPNPVFNEHLTTKEEQALAIATIAAFLRDAGLIHSENKLPAATSPGFLPPDKAKEILHALEQELRK